jgi:ubiquinone/menaquinone biosynthesis C-methylase UbiE
MPDSHPLFTRLYDRLMRPIEALGMSRKRAMLIAGARGLVLEVGAGTGLNLPHYREATWVIATEPVPAMLDQAGERARSAQVPVRLLCADAQSLPFADETFDCAVASCVFCTVPDPSAGFRELRRVLKPGGELRLLEHVRAPNPLAARLQDFAAPGWSRLAGGCQLNRPTLATAQAAGFRLVRSEIRLGGVLIAATLARD